MSKVAISAPPLGWNSYDGFGCHIYESLCMEELAAFAQHFAPHGYEYFVIDNGWFSEQQLMEADGFKLPRVQHAEPEHVCIDDFGIPQPSVCFFPNGFRPIVDFGRAHGIKIGLHLMRGIPRKAVEANTPIKGTKFRARDIADVEDTCAWCDYMYGIDMSKPGAQAYLDSVIEQFAQWGVEFVKVDDVSHRPAEVEGYVRAVETASGPICLSLSPGNHTNKRFLDTYRDSAMCRITKDIWDNQPDIDVAFNYWKSWQGLEEPGFYPDLDMIPFGELCVLKRPENFKRGANANFCAGQLMHHRCTLTEAQKETFITQRAMSASPLMIGGRLHTMDPHSVRLLTHPDVLACNQNGVMGADLRPSPEGLEIFVTPERSLDATGMQRYEGSDRGWVGVFNRSAEPVRIALGPAQLGLKRRCDEAETPVHVLRDIWRGGEHQVVDDSVDIEIAAHGVAFYRFEKQPVAVLHAGAEQHETAPGVVSAV